MKRIFLLAILLVSSVLLFGCGDDEKGPAILSGPRETTIRYKSDFDPLAGISAKDSVKGDVSNKITYEGTVDTDVEGEYIITYTIIGSDGSKDELVRKVIVENFTLNGVSDRNVALGVASFNTKSGVYLMDPQIGRKNAYVEAEYDAHFEITGEVDTKTEGVYEIVYKATVENVTITHTRTITVVSQPMIYGANDVNVEINKEFNPKLNVTASESILDEEGNPTTITRTEYLEVTGTEDLDLTKTGEYTLTYRIKVPVEDGEEDEFEYLKDAQGEIVEVERIVTVYIRVEILNVAAVEIEVGGEFDPKAGIEARDSLLGDITADIEVEGTVDVSTVGSYTLVYTVVGSEGNTDTKERIVAVIPKTAGKQTIIIMSGDPRELDPFRSDYTGTDQRKRQDIQRAAEAKHDVEVKYPPYPDNAAWGPSRIDAIIQASVSGSRMADIFYHVTTDWIPQMASGGGIAPIDFYLSTPGGQKLEPTMLAAGLFNRKYYGFNPGSLSLESGLYFNADLVDELGVPNPTDLYLAGEWTWSTFEAWALQTQAALKAVSSEENPYYTLGGHFSYYAENMIPLNGGEFINERTKKVAFTARPAVDTIAFIEGLYKDDLFEPNRGYDAGSAEWRGGRVVMHPGDLWFITAENRWGPVSFELGFVPYPMGDDYRGEYKSPIYGVSMAMLSSGMSAARAKLVLDVWIDLQIWDEGTDFETYLLTKFDDQRYVDAYLSISDKVYAEVLNAMVSSHGADAFRVNVNSGIVNGDYRSRLESIAPIYQNRIDEYYSE